MHEEQPDPASNLQLGLRPEAKLEAAAFRSLISHLRGRSDVDNKDLMKIAGFSRDSLARWYREAAEVENIDVSNEEAFERIYGVPEAEWKAKHPG